MVVQGLLPAYRSALIAVLCLCATAIPAAADPVPAQPVLDLIDAMTAMVVDYTTNFDPTQDPAALLEQSDAFLLAMADMVDIHDLTGACISFGAVFKAGPILWDVNPTVETAGSAVHVQYDLPGAGRSGSQVSQGVYSINVQVRRVMGLQCGLLLGS